MVDAGYCMMIEISKWPQSLKRLVNKLQNVMFSNTRRNCIYSNSAARAHGARVQGSRPKHEENLRWKTVTRYLLGNIFIIVLKACDNVISVTNIFQIRNDNHLLIWCCQQKEAQIFLRVFYQNKSWEKATTPTFINVSIVILLLFCKIK